MSILRFVLGPTFNAARSIPVTPPDPDKPPRLDVEIALTGVDADAWTVGLAIPAYTLDSHNLLSEVRIYLVPSGHGLPSTAADYVSSSYPFESVDLRANMDGANVTIPLPEVEPGDYLGQTVLVFQDDATAPDPAPLPPPSEDGPPPPDEATAVPGDVAAPTTG